MNLGNMDNMNPVNLNNFICENKRFPNENEEYFSNYIHIRKNRFEDFSNEFTDYFSIIGDIPTEDEWKKLNYFQKKKIYFSYCNVHQKKPSLEKYGFIIDIQKTTVAVKSPNKSLIKENIKKLEEFVKTNNRWPNKNEELFNFYKYFRNYSFEYELNENTRRFFKLFYDMGELPDDNEWELCEREIRKEIFISFVKKHKRLPKNSENKKIYQWYYNVKHSNRESDKEFIELINEKLEVSPKKVRFVLSSSTQTELSSGKVVKNTSIKDDFELTFNVIRDSFEKYNNLPEVFKGWFEKQKEKHSNFELSVSEMQQLKEINKFFK